MRSRTLRLLLPFMVLTRSRCSAHVGAGSRCSCPPYACALAILAQPNRLSPASHPTVVDVHALFRERRSCRSIAESDTRRTTALPKLGMVAVHQCAPLGERKRAGGPAATFGGTSAQCTSAGALGAGQIVYGGARSVLYRSRPAALDSWVGG